MATELQAGQAFFDLVPKLDKSAAAATEAQAGAAFEGISGKAKATGLAIGAGLVAGAGLIAVGLVKISGSFDDAFDSIRVTTGKTGVALDGLKDSFRTVVAGVPDDLAKVGTAIGEINQRTGVTGPALEGLATQFLNLSRITETDLSGNIEAASELFTNFGIKAADQAGKLDVLFRASQATGTSVADLAKSMASGGSVLRQVGFNFEQSAALVGLLGKAGVDAGSVMGPLSKAIATAAKSGEDATSVFRSTFDAIRKAPDATTAAGAAIDVFGAKAGPKLAGLIREGKLSYDELAKSIAGGPETINGAAAATEDFAEKFARLKNKVLLVLEPLAGKFFDGLTKIAEFGERNFAPTLERIIAALTKVGDAAGFVADHWNILGPIFIGVATIIGTVVIPHFIAMGVEAVINAAKTVAAWVSTQVAALTAAAIHSAQVIAMVAGWVLLGVQSLLNAAKVAAAWLISIGPIAIVIAAVIGLVAVIVKNWETIKDAITTAVGFVLDFLRNNWPLILAIITGPIGVAVLTIIKHWDTIKEAFTKAKDWIIGIFNDVVGFITGLPGRIARAAAGMWDGIRDGFKAALNWIIRAWNSLEFTLPGFEAFGKKIGGFTIGLPDIPELAAGGMTTAGGLSIVGEGGRAGELVNLPRGATVVPLDVARMIAAAAGEKTAPVIGGDLVLQGAEMTPADIVAELGWYSKSSGR